MLSDVCFEVNGVLAKALVEYMWADYPQEQVDDIKHAMYLLARVQMQNDAPNWGGKDLEYAAKLEAGSVENVADCLKRARKDAKKDDVKWQQKLKEKGML